MQALGIRAAQKGLELACRIAPDVPDGLIGDPGRLRQVVVNLVGNAIKFTEHGEVVRGRRAWRRGPRRRGPSCISPCSDTGIGIPADKQQLIFEAFSRPTARRRGSSAAPAWAWPSRRSWSS